eukprot:GDKJ01017302.1.p1 GENE.GDKJ01017302.1~~GDKJ01017302.1.p1  ORF type:complete len:752 (+),score=199.89 GDKJ01017302.1:230-2257(+)
MNSVILLFHLAGLGRFFADEWSVKLDGEWGEKAWRLFWRRAGFTRLEFAEFWKVARIATFAKGEVVLDVENQQNTLGVVLRGVVRHVSNPVVDEKTGDTVDTIILEHFTTYSGDLFYLQEMTCLGINFGALQSSFTAIASTDNTVVMLVKHEDIFKIVSNFAPSVITYLRNYVAYSFGHTISRSHASFLLKKIQTDSREDLEPLEWFQGGETNDMLPLRKEELPPPQPWRNPFKWFIDAWSCFPPHGLRHGQPPGNVRLIRQKMRENAIKRREEEIKLKQKIENTILLQAGVEINHSAADNKEPEQQPCSASEDTTALREGRSALLQQTVVTHSSRTFDGPTLLKLTSAEVNPGSAFHMPPHSSRHSSCSAQYQPQFVAPSFTTTGAGFSADSEANNNFTLHNNNNFGAHHPGLMMDRNNATASPSATCATVFVPKERGFTILDTASLVADRPGNNQGLTFGVHSKRSLSPQPSPRITEYHHQHNSQYQYNNTTQLISSSANNSQNKNFPPQQHQPLCNDALVPNSQSGCNTTPFGEVGVSPTVSPPPVDAAQQQVSPRAMLFNLTGRSKAATQTGGDTSSSSTSGEEEELFVNETDAQQLLRRQETGNAPHLPIDLHDENLLVTSSIGSFLDGLSDLHEDEEGVDLAFDKEADEAGWRQAASKSEMAVDRAMRG